MAPTDTNTDSTRWGGTLVGLGALLVACALILLTVSQEEPTGLPDGASAAEAEAAFYVQNEGLLEAVHFMELFGGAAIAAGAFMLVTRTAPTGNRIPPSAAWILVGLGALAWTGIVAAATWALPTVAANYQGNEILFETMLQGMDALWAVVGFMLIGGLALALVSEAGNADRAANGWLLWLGALTHATALLFPLSDLLGTQLYGNWTFFVAAAGLLITCLYTLAIAFPALRAVTGAARTRKTTRGRTASN